MSDSPRIPFSVVALPAEIDNYQAAVDFLLGQLVLQGSVLEEAIPRLTQGIHDRERLGSTAIGKGIAIPHCRTDAVTAVIGILGESAADIAWPRSADGQPVRRVCLMVAPKEAHAETLGTLEQIVLAFRSEIR